MGYSAESTPTPGNNTQGRDGHRTSSACLLRWTDTEIAKTNLDSAAQLLSCFQEHRDSPRQLLVFHGLPADHCVALKEATGIDASFIDAHAGRRAYRPRRAGVKAAWAHYDYPELVRQSSAFGHRQHTTAAHDLVGAPPTYTASTTGDSIMLCRASIWLSDKAHILFLDRAPWEDPKSGVSRGRYKAYTAEGMPDEDGVSTITMQIDAKGNATTRGDEIPSLETMLYDGLRDGCSGHEDLLQLLEELVVNKWADFFEAPSLDLPVGSTETTALFSQALGCLERNLDVSRHWHKMRQRSVEPPPDTHPLLDARPQSATTEWEGLLSRLSRRAQLLSHLTSARRWRSEKTHADAGLGISLAGDRGDKYDCRPRNNNNNSATTNPSTPDEGQRALNRVAYLGGVLLPFSVVSGILAIEEPYGPGGSQFWIFWAVTVPLTLVTLGVIYADSIRKVQVWVEVAASGKSGSASDTETDPRTYSLPLRVQTDVEQAVRVSSRIAEPITFTENFDVADEREDGDGDEDEDEGAEPDMMVEKRWKNAPAYQIDAGSGDDEWMRKKKWRKEELGWAGACATLFQVYKLKKGVPPRHLRHNDKRDGLPRRVRTN
ncbi:hypothetical protein F4823DRAFT_622172 [Ustulina deusta]|nr:hypothetical protein F4823DRAFT_622172 [Ustulina deusta]